MKKEKDGDYSKEYSDKFYQNKKQLPNKWVNKDPRQEYDNYGPKDKTSKEQISTEKINFKVNNSLKKNEQTRDSDTGYVKKSEVAKDQVTSYQKNNREKLVSQMEQGRYEKQRPEYSNFQKKSSTYQNKKDADYEDEEYVSTTKNQGYSNYTIKSDAFKKDSKDKDEENFSKKNDNSILKKPVLDNNKKQIQTGLKRGTGNRHKNKGGYNDYDYDEYEKKG